MIRAYVVDDEPPAVERLSRMLEKSGRVEIVGRSTDSVVAAEDLSRLHPDVLFLDIRMPELSGFDLLAQVPEQPLVVFTTAYDEYALEAFSSHAIDYLLKPIDPEQLDRALSKADRFVGERTHDRDLAALLGQIGAALSTHASGSGVSDLEAKLDPARFVRIHRGVILNLDHLLELHGGFGGRMIVRLRSARKTELSVSRNRVRALKQKLGL